MRSIGVLSGMRKEKPCSDRPFCPAGGTFSRKIFPCCVFLQLLLYCAVPGAAAADGKDTTLSTRQGEAVIGKDPVTGDRVMRTPDPRPQEGYQGPQTIIVAPEVHPGRPRGSGGSRPPRPQPRQ